MVLDNLKLEIASEFDELDRIVDLTTSFFATHIDDEERVYNIVLLTTEAVTNAIEHGNQLDPLKRVKIVFEVHEDRYLVSVADEGRGFSRSVVQNPLDADHLLDDGGRGIFLMEELADEVNYEDDGQRISMVFLKDGTAEL